MYLAIVIDGQVVGTMDFFAIRTLVFPASRENGLRNAGFLLGQALGWIGARERVDVAGR